MYWYVNLSSYNSPMARRLSMQHTMLLKPKLTTWSNSSLKYSLWSVALSSAKDSYNKKQLIFKILGCVVWQLVYSFFIFLSNYLILLQSQVVHVYIFWNLFLSCNPSLIRSVPSRLCDVIHCTAYIMVSWF